MLLPLRHLMSFKKDQAQKWGYNLAYKQYKKYIYLCVNEIPYVKYQIEDYIHSSYFQMNTVDTRLGCMDSNFVYEHKKVAQCQLAEMTGVRPARVQ